MASATGQPPPPVAPSQPPRSFASVLTSSSPNAGSSWSSKSFSDISLPNCPPGQYKGEPAAFFSKDEFYKVPPILQHALVGKFSHGRPSMEVIRKAFLTIGLKGVPQIGLLDPRHVLLRVQNEEDYFRLWLKGSWSIAGFQIRLFKWDPDFRLNYEPSLVPIWLTFDNLPLTLFRKTQLFRLAQAIGKPLKIDEATVSLTRPSLAKVCVEADVSKPLPRRVWVGIEEAGFWQPVTYDSIPLYCSHCSKIGHDVQTCRFTLSHSEVKDSDFMDAKLSSDVKMAAGSGHSETRAAVQIWQPKIGRESRKEKADEDREGLKSSFAAGLVEEEFKVVSPLMKLAKKSTLHMEKKVGKSQENELAESSKVQIHKKSQNCDDNLPSSMHCEEEFQRADKLQEVDPKTHNENILVGPQFHHDALEVETPSLSTKIKEHEENSAQKTQLADKVKLVGHEIHYNVFEPLGIQSSATEKTSAQDIQAEKEAQEVAHGVVVAPLQMVEKNSNVQMGPTKPMESSLARKFRENSEYNLQQYRLEERLKKLKKALEEG